MVKVQSPYYILSPKTVKLKSAVQQGSAHFPACGKMTSPLLHLECEYVVNTSSTLWLRIHVKEQTHQPDRYHHYHQYEKQICLMSVCTLEINSIILLGKVSQKPGSYTIL